MKRINGPPCVVFAQIDVTDPVVRELGASRVAAVGNGRNDQLMLAEAALGIAVLGPEGASPLALAAADVVVPSVEDALDLLLIPNRLKATLRG